MTNTNTQALSEPDDLPSDTEYAEGDARANPSTPAPVAAESGSLSVRAGGVTGHGEKGQGLGADRVGRSAGDA